MNENEKELFNYINSRLTGTNTWYLKTKEDAENYDKRLQYAKPFVDDIIKVYEKHKLSISFSEQDFDFVIEDYNEYSVDWLKDAIVESVRKGE